MKTHFICLGLAVMLLACLMDLPYGYFGMVRFLGMIGFAYLGYKQYTTGNSANAITFAVLALLFQPFIKLPLGRELWNVVDMVVAAFLLTVWYKGLRNK